MFARIRWAALLVGAAAVGSAPAADDTVRLVARPADPDDTRTLDLRPGDKTADDTQKTCCFFGHCCGPRVSYFSYYYAPPVYYAPPAVSYYYSAPAVSYFYTPTYYTAPVYYYAAPVVSYSYGYYYPIALRSREAAPPAERPRDEQPKSYRYDADRPADRIPPAREATPAVPELPASPALPKLGPSPTERTVRLPARTKVTYPAYGDDRPPARDDTTRLIRAR